jgi:hypothetical protein
LSYVVLISHGQRSDQEKTQEYSGLHGEPPEGRVFQWLKLI